MNFNSNLFGFFVSAIGGFVAGVILCIIAMVVGA